MSLGRQNAVCSDFDRCWIDGIRVWYEWASRDGQLNRDWGVGPTATDRPVPALGPGIGTLTQL